MVIVTNRSVRKPIPEAIPIYTIPILSYLIIYLFSSSLKYAIEVHGRFNHNEVARHQLR